MLVLACGPWPIVATVADASVAAEGVASAVAAGAAAGVAAGVAGVAERLADWVGCGVSYLLCNCACNA